MTMAGIAALMAFIPGIFTNLGSYIGSIAVAVGVITDVAGISRGRESTDIPFTVHAHIYFRSIIGMVRREVPTCIHGVTMAIITIIFSYPFGTYQSLVTK